MPLRGGEECVGGGPSVYSALLGGAPSPCVHCRLEKPDWPPRLDGLQGVSVCTRHSPQGKNNCGRRRETTRVRRLLTGHESCRCRRCGVFPTAARHVF